MGMIGGDTLPRPEATEAGQGVRQKVNLARLPTSPPGKGGSTCGPKSSTSDRVAVPIPYLALSPDRGSRPLDRRSLTTGWRTTAVGSGAVVVPEVKIAREYEDRR